ncbi:MAG: hypothetical protein ACLFP8_00755 [Alphaproteobacteria bacterium]
MNNKGLLIIIILLLLGIFAIILMEATEESPSEQIANDIGEVTEELGNQLDEITADTN